MIISKRANQIASDRKQELTRNLADLSNTNDALEETFENREQIEISKYYERLPKPTIVATEEFLAGKVYFRDTKDDPIEEIAKEEKKAEQSAERSAGCWRWS